MRKTIRTASIAELKARLSEFLAAVKRGEEIIVTERAVPVARLSPLADRDVMEGRTRELIRSGLLKPPMARLPKDFMTRPMPADPDGSVVDALVREREEGW